jgi:predicted nucleotidyltransferase
MGESVKACRLPAMVERVVRRYVRAFAPDRIILFGSYAKGAGRPGSDVDLLIIADVESDRAHRLCRAHQLAQDCFPPVDVVLATPQEATAAAAVESPFLLSILESGVVLYRRA